MDDLPRGAVTFLFTDIEGSTRLVKQLREGYTEVLAAHQRLLREAFAQHGGHEVDTQGDAFFVVFSSAREAVLAAVEGQRALSGYPWPGGADLKVRMGIHTGQAAPVDGRYTGLAVHRAARIAAAGHGGQVLVSQATQTLLEDEEEDLAVTLNDLGTQRLKDLDRPVQLYQVQGPGLEAEFPPVRGEDDPAAPAAAARVPLRRRRLVILGAATVAVAAIAAALAVVLAGGESGGLATVDPNHLAVIDTQTNKVVDEASVGIAPGPLAVGGGSVWVGNTGDRNLTRIDVRSRTALATLSLNDRTPTGVAVGTGGVWVAHGPVGTLARVDPGYGRVAKTLDLARPTHYGAVAIGGGSVWVVFGDSTLARIDGRSQRLLDTGLAGASPSAIVYAAGSVWVANSGNQTVSRFDPETFTEGPVSNPISVGEQPLALAFGAGALWVANAGDGTVTRIAPDSQSVATIAVGGRPVAIAATDDGVWVADQRGVVSRIDPAKRQVVRTIRLGNPAAGIAVGGGSVWVSVRAP
jgi:class 3 adenylate cyclase/DNA-binding beta-propeller fold protein YncE